MANYDYIGCREQFEGIVRDIGNGYPKAGDYVAGRDGDLYHVESVDMLGQGEYIHVTVEPAYWSDAPAGFVSRGLYVHAFEVKDAQR